MNWKSYIVIFIVFWGGFSILRAQAVSFVLPDSAEVISTAQTYIEQKQFASAHALLDSAIHVYGLVPQFICLQIANVLQHHFTHKDFKTFYLRNYPESWNNARSLQLQNTAIRFIRYPNRILEKLIEKNPKIACAYKLLGDYYNLILSNKLETFTLSQKEIQQLEKQILDNYEKAVANGYRDPEVFLWLGDYYQRQKQYRQAQQYYQKTLQVQHNNAVANFRLAQIYYHEKQYSQAITRARLALDNFSEEDIYLRYDALILLAKSYHALGETDAFIDAITEAIQFLPDQQQAYLLLIAHYEEQGQIPEAEAVFRQMFVHNPYDRPGFRRLEQFVVKHNDFLFSEALFEELVVKFESNDEVLGNLYWFRGNILWKQGLTGEAQQMWQLATKYLKKCYPPQHPIFKEIGRISRTG